jgi:hypothetical protein
LENVCLGFWSGLKRAVACIVPGLEVSDSATPLERVFPELIWIFLGCVTEEHEEPVSKFAVCEGVVFTVNPAEVGFTDLPRLSASRAEMK